MTTTANPDKSADIIVVGSGGAALVAAITAAAKGGRVLLLERSSKFGGTTAYSGGKVWIPNNHHMQSLGIADSIEAAKEYILRITGGEFPHMIDSFLKFGPEMVDFVERITPLRFYACTKFPDYQPQFPGGTTGGRVLDPIPYDASRLGSTLEKIRRSPIFLPFIQTEWEQWRSPVNFDWELIGERVRRNIFTTGAALVAALVQGCLDLGVQMLTGSRVLRLTQEGDRITGVEAEQDGGTIRYQAHRGVIIASGGFEWNRELTRNFLRGPEQGAASPPWNEGDGLLMGAEVGARLANTSEAWWVPVVQIPGEEADGKPLFRTLIAERGLPGSMIVNQRGRRFVNESHNYNDISKLFHVSDPNTLEYPNIPAWFIFDEAFHKKYSVTTIMPGERVPSWVTTAPSPAELAAKLGIDEQGLTETITRFNANAKMGKDPEFQRGDSVYDHYYGDPSAVFNPNLAPLEEGPYYAIPVLPGTMGTKGGLLTDEKGRVLNWRKKVIPGLCAAGNIASFWAGGGYAGPGASIGPAMTFGYVCSLTLMSAEGGSARA